MDKEQQAPIVERQQPQNSIEENNTELVNKNNSLPKKRKFLFLAIIILFLLITITITTFAYFKYQEKGESIKINISTTTTNLTNSPTPTDGTLPTPEVVQKELIVKYRQGMGPDEISIERKAEIDKMFSELGIILQEKMYESSSSALKNYYIINFEKEVDLDSTIDIIKELPEVENVEKNYINQVD